MFGDCRRANKRHMQRSKLELIEIALIEGPAVRVTGVTEHWIGLPHQSALMLAARITLPHFSVSSAISFPNSAGDPGSGLPPNLRYRGIEPTTAGPPPEVINHGKDKDITGSGNRACARFPGPSGSSP